MHSFIYQNTLMTEAERELRVDFKEDPAWMMTMMLQKPVSRATTALTLTLWHVSPNVLACLLHCTSCVSVFPAFLRADRRGGISCVRVCVSPGNVTDGVLQQTDLVSSSGLRPANEDCQSTPWQLLVPPTVSIYPEMSEKYALMDQSLKSTRVTVHIGLNSIKQRLTVELNVT